MQSIMSAPAVWQIEFLHIQKGSAGKTGGAFFGVLRQRFLPFPFSVNHALTVFQLLFLVSSMQFCYCVDTRP